MDGVSKTNTDATQGEEVPPAPAQPDLSGVFGDFVIVRVLGQGGMGQVYLAEQRSLKRKVALKFLRPELAANAASLARFQAEAHSVARINHANIVQIYAIGNDAGQHFMALEYVEGTNLRDFLQKKGPPELLVGLRIMAQVAAALQRASEMGIVHRDIKPENILLTKKGEVKVTDFGLSRCFEQPLNLTQSGVTMGTPLYMAPEQVEGKPITPRTDIYSFGITCYHLFAGHPPFRGSTPFEVAYQHVQKEPHSLAEIRPDLPIELCQLIHRMMAKDPEQRIQTGREIAREISRLRDAVVGVTSGTGPILTQSNPALMPPPSSSGTIALPKSRSPWFRFLGPVATILGLAIGVGIGWVTLRPTTAPVGPVNPVSADPIDPQVKALFSVSDRERELSRLVQENLRAEDPLSAAAGLKYAIELGNFYLKERRLEDGQKFFAELTKPEQKHASFQLMGRIGNASVLAFKDMPTESNKQFAEIVREMELFERKPLLSNPFKGNLKKEPGKIRDWKEQFDAYRILWKDNPVVREMVARALSHNYQNNPKDFPPLLEPYRQPPRPQLRPATPEKK